MQNKLIITGILYIEQNKQYTEFIINFMDEGLS